MKQQNKIVVIYHRADFDGLFCREIARKFINHSNVEFIGWDYGDQVPVVSNDDTLFMLDISIEGLMGHPKLTWIDHHKSAMEKYLNPESWNWSSYRYHYCIDGVAACRLTWEYFQRWDDQHGALAEKEAFVNRTLPEPMAVRLAGEYDIWDKRDPNAELFQHGLRSRELNSGWWEDLLGENSWQYCHVLLDAGNAIQYAKTQENESIIKANGFTVEFEGLKFLACNAARYNSHLFTAGLTPEHDGCLGFNWDGTQWKVSLYHAPGKEHHDLSIIATKYGGGGHRGACGFRVDKLPFLPT